MIQSHRFDPSILREYDIRGIVGDTLGTDDAGALGHAFGSLVARQEGAGAKICVGYDGRFSSPDLAQALSRGLAATGARVLDVGRGPTPMLYHAVHVDGAGGGIMVTGSHNPPDHNGFKLMLGTRSLHGEAIAEIGDLARDGDFVEGDGSVEAAPALERYVEALVRAHDGGRPLRVAWDAGNGAAGEAMARLTARLPGTHFLLYEQIDGGFPNHHPDPTVAANLTDLQDLVRAESCDLGFAFDGDGDRIGVVDGKGRILWGDHIIALMARGVLAEYPGATVIAEVKASQMLFDEITRLGGVPLMWRTGHSLIKDKMAELGAPLAGEMSGHIFLADKWYGFDDALYVAVRFLNLAAASSGTVADMRDSLPALVNTPELRFDCAEERKFEVVEEVAARLRAAGADVNEIDGVRVSTADGWWLLRASNTQAVLVARCESGDEAGLIRLKEELGAQLSQSGVEPPSM